MATSAPPFEDPEEALCELPPSSKFVAKVLAGEDPMTQGEIAAETLLSGRTVRDALSRLEEAGVVRSRHSFVDARRRLYWID